VDLGGPKDILNGGQEPPWDGAVLMGDRRPIVKYMKYCPCVMAMRLFVELLLSLVIPVTLNLYLNITLIVVHFCIAFFK